MAMSVESAVPFVVRMSDGNIIKLEYYQSLPSSSALARKYAREGYPDRYVVLAEQTDSSQSTGIYMSLILRPSIFPSQAVFIGPLASVASALALGEHTSNTIGIGWVSDIFCDGELIGDVSVEGKLDSFTSYEYLILNFSIRLGKNRFPPRLTDMVRQVFESENASIPMIIAKNILSKFFSLYSSIKSPQKIMSTYDRLFALRGEKIKCNIDGSQKTCKVLGVDNATCALVVELRNGRTEKVTTRAGVTVPKKLKKKQA